MKKGQDISIQFPGLLIIHQKVPGKELGRHTHDEHEIFIPLQGEISVEFGGKVVGCSSGKMLYVPPGLDHGFSSASKGEGERVIFLVSDKLWKKRTEKQFDPTSMPLNSLVRELIFYLLVNPKTEHSKTFITALIESLVEQLDLQSKLKLDGRVHLEAKITDERIKKVFNEIINGSELAVPELAEKCGLSTRNLNRLFSAEVGVPPKQLMIMLKLEKARELLLTSNMTITDISFEVGYNSLSKFISTFQKYVGQLPSEFRQRNQARG